MVMPERSDALRELEQQLSAIALRMKRLRESITKLEATGARPDDQLELLAALGAAQSRLMDHRERLSRRSLERE